MNNLKRFTVCKVAGHKWAKVTSPQGADGSRHHRPGCRPVL